MYFNIRKMLGNLRFDCGVDLVGSFIQLFAFFENVFLENEVYEGTKNFKLASSGAEVVIFFASRNDWVDSGSLNLALLHFTLVSDSCNLPTLYCIQIKF